MFSSRTLTDREIPDFDIREDYLEDHWGDEAKCELSHKDLVGNDDYSTCSHSAVAAFRVCWDDESPLICANYVAAIEALQADTCDECDRPISECWSMIPV